MTATFEDQIAALVAEGRKLFPNTRLSVAELRDLAHEAHEAALRATEPLWGGHGVGESREPRF